jgi:hypothetical protein
LFKFNHVVENPSRRLSQVLLAALFGALLLAMFVNTASAQSSAAIGRMFTGEVQSVSTVNGLLAIESKRTLFQLAVSSNTVINVPPDKDVGMAGLPSQLGFRIAGLATEAITDGNGIPHAEVRTALKIVVIPSKATRSHKRTIASDKDGDNLTTLDEDGKKRALASLGAGIEKGEAVIILVQKPGRDATEEKVRGLFRAKSVTDRLERFTKAETADPIKQSVIAGLRDKLSDAQEKRLQKTAENTEAGLREFVLSRVKAMQEDRQAEVKQRGVGADVSECARTIVGTRATSIKDLTADQRQRVTDECLKPKPDVTPTPVVITSPVVRITSPTSGTVVGAKDVVTVTAEAKDDVGVTSVTFNVAGVDQAPQTETPYTIDVTVLLGVTTLAIKATAVDADGNNGSDSIVLRVERRSGDLGIKFTSPTATLDSARTIRPSTVAGSTGAIVQGDTIAVIAEVTGTGVVTVVFNIAGVDQTPDSEPPYAMRYFVPFTSDAVPAPLVITATATDASGDSISDTATVQIIRKVTDVNVKITNPVPSDKLTAGATIVIRAETGNDADIAFVTFSVGGVDTVRTVAPFTHTYVLPGRKTTKAATSSIPPKVFVGKVTLGGKSALRGTKVTAWIAGTDSTTLTIKVTATANSGETDIATVLVPVSGAVNAGETTVAEGEYVLNAAQPSGQSFTGKTVTFTIGDKDAKETGIWKQGGATILDLTAD